MNKDTQALQKTLQAYGIDSDAQKKRILMLSEINTIPFLEQTFANHPSYTVINETLENIIDIGTQTYLKQVSAAINNGDIHFDGITGFFNTPNALACILSHLTGKISIPLESMLNCQSKYQCRLLQQQSIPEYTPDFLTDEQFLAQDNSLHAALSPVFVKPFRAARSFASAKIETKAELSTLMEKNADKLQTHNQPYIDAIGLVTNDPSLLDIANTSNQFIAEEVIQGEQYAVDGYVYQGNIVLHGIVKEVFLPNSISFERHEFPTDLSAEWVTRIEDMAERLLRQAKLDNTEFDIEFRIDFEQDKLQIIEINPYAVSQYENLYTLAGGDQMLTTMCALACGDKPPARVTPPYRFCYSCELRTYEDCEIRHVPSAETLAAIKAEYPDIRVVNRIPIGSEKLSDFRQTEDTYRYCIVSIPGQSPEEIAETLAIIEQKLDYQLIPLDNTTC